MLHKLTQMRKYRMTPFEKKYSTHLRTDIIQNPLYKLITLIEYKNRINSSMGAFVLAMYRSV